MKNEIVKTPAFLANIDMKAMEKASESLDEVVNYCVPFAGTAITSFKDGFIIAKGIEALRVILDQPEIRATVEAMQDSPLGFITDRSPAAIAAAKGAYKPKTIIPYTYNEVKECCIEGMMKGYRIAGGEFNIIASRFYPGKDGKYRKIVEFKDVFDFTFQNTTPIFDTEERHQWKKIETVSFAKVQCYAQWKKGGKDFTIGHGEDKSPFKIKVNSGMGDDGVVGKALSKLFSRVLARISGTTVSDADIDDSQLLPRLDTKALPASPVVGVDIYAKTNQPTTQGGGADPTEAFDVLAGNPEMKQVYRTSPGPEKYPKLENMLPKVADKDLQPMYSVAWKLSEKEIRQIAFEICDLNALTAADMRFILHSLNVISTAKSL